MLNQNCFVFESQGKKCFQNEIFKNLLVWNHKAQTFYIWYIASSSGSLPFFSNVAPGVKIYLAPGVKIVHWNILGKIEITSSLKLLKGIWPNFTGMFPKWSSTTITKTIPVGCISRSRVQEIDFQDAMPFQFQTYILSWLLRHLLKSGLVQKTIQWLCCCCTNDFEIDSLKLYILNGVKTEMTIFTYTML